MKNILIVDDEKSFADSLAEGLNAHDKELAVTTADNGKAAVSFLENNRIDLVLTDLNMPEMDGFGLLSYLNRNHREIPVIIMTAFFTPEIEKTLNGLGVHQFLEKPLDFNTLVDKIYDALAKGKQGFISGITLATFLQYVELEKKTCTIRINSDDRLGILHIQNGELLDAELGALRGQEAALEIVRWNDTDIRIEDVCRVKDKTIETGLNHLLMESFRLMDENKRVNVEDMVAEEIVAGKYENAAPASPEGSGTEQNINGRGKMATIKELMQELLKSSGVKTAVVVGRDGFVIDGASNGAHLDTETVGAVISAGIGSSEVMGRELNVGVMNQGMMEYDDGLIMMSLVGTDAILAVVAEANVNLGYVRLQIKKRIPEIEKAL
jgi:CheY-like chemotaxis protein/predicted regulator of Ras-like GTPase activity (Roadblock/LC7/MglB family)